MSSKFSKVTNLKSVRGRLLAFQVMVISLLIAVVVASFLVYKNSINAKFSLIDELAKEVSSLQEIRNALTEQLESWKDVLIRGKSPQGYYENLSKFYESERLVLRRLSELESLNIDSAFLLAVDKFRQSHRFLGKQSREAISLYNSTQNSSHVIADKFVAGYDKHTLNALTGITQAVKSYKASQLELLNKQLDLVVNVAVVVASMIVLMAIFVLFWIVDRKIGKPISRAIEAANQIAKGDFSAKLSKPLSDDEIGSLMHAISDMQLSLSNTMLSLEHANTEVESRTKDLERTVTELKNENQERMRIEQELRCSKDEAERANELKTEFLGRMSHELRTPMNAILGFGQLMELDQLQPGQKGNLKEIMLAGKHLLQLIDEVLDLSTIESGKSVFIYQDFMANDLIDECIASMRPLAAEHGITMSIDMSDCADIWLRMDQRHTKQVLLNLISNAIKYNKAEGNVLVNCEQVIENRLRINVIDTGPGVDEEKQYLLFEPFSRLGQEYGEKDGTGIGLSIARRLMELMGGDIGMQSIPSGGSMFWIECNISQSATQEIVSSENTLKTSRIDLPKEYSKILYIEDNPANMRLIENILIHSSNAEMLAAPTAEMGIELARKYIPDLILMDINLPGMDGYDALSRLRNYPETKNIPVIAISAAAMSRDINRGLAAGFRYYLTKPIQVNEFLDVIKDLLQMKDVSAGH